jgi:hypothetical protein
MRRIGILVLLVFMVCSGLTAQMLQEDEMFGFVIGIEGKSRQGRADFVKNQLRKMNVGFFTVPFDYYNYRVKDTLNLSGEDIVARIGTGQKRLVVGAHFDAADSSPGANDNGSGVAVILELIKSLKDYPWNCTVDFVFFDQEEKGLLGSQFYIDRVVERKKHYGMINLDVEGSGNEVYVGPVGGGDDDFLMPFVRRAANRTKYSYREKDWYPSSDFASFAAMRLENISISVVPKGDADLLSLMTRSDGKVDAKDMPKVMKVMHTPNDRSNQMTTDALKISYQFTRTLLQLLNESVH